LAVVDYSTLRIRIQMYVYLQGCCSAFSIAVRGVADVRYMAVLGVVASPAPTAAAHAHIRIQWEPLGHCPGPRAASAAAVSQVSSSAAPARALLAASANGVSGPPSLSRPARLVHRRPREQPVWQRRRG
jgi:hypothetical protein